MLAARLEAVLRRYKTSEKMELTLKKSGIELDPAGRTVKIAGKAISCGSSRTLWTSLDVVTRGRACA